MVENYFYFLYYYLICYNKGNTNMVTSDQKEDQL